MNPIKIRYIGYGIVLLAGVFFVVFYVTTNREPNAPTDAPKKIPVPVVKYTLYNVIKEVKVTGTSREIILTTSPHNLSPRVIVDSNTKIFTLKNKVRTETVPEALHAGQNIGFITSWTVKENTWTTSEIIVYQ